MWLTDLLSNPEELTGWAIAVLFLLFLMMGWLQPSRIVRDKERMMQREIDRLTLSVEYEREANKVLTASVHRLASLTANTNEVVTAVSAIAQGGGK